MEEVKQQSTKAKGAAFQRGIIVLIVLAFLTAVEYLIAIELQAITILAVIGLIKAAIIVQYFMHISNIFSEEGSH